MDLSSNNKILRACSAIVDERLLDAAEKKMLENVVPLNGQEARAITQLIKQGDDPLGDAFIRANSAKTRRRGGETYTPKSLVDYMVTTAANIAEPGRVIDVGCGSGRFAVACAHAFPNASIVAIDVSPLATLMCKAAICALGLQDRATVIRDDFTAAEIPIPLHGERTLWIGNPPYVRHHDIVPERKRWFIDAAQMHGLRASGLAGMHAHFVLSIASRVQPGDFGMLVTSAEWLDVNYGSVIRDLLTSRLIMRSIKLYDFSQQVFQGTETTATVFSFEAHRAEHVNLKKEGNSVIVLSSEGASRVLSLEQFAQTDRWSQLINETEHEEIPEGFVKLGEFARVHRGIVTGANKFWVRSSVDEQTEKITIPVVSHAREIMTGTKTLNPNGLSRLIALPPDLDTLTADEAEQARELIAEGRKLGIDKGYVARSRKCWWSISVGDGATILMTYMARRAPVFVANPNRIRSLNVVHGIYPIVELSNHAVTGLVDYLNSSVARNAGRTYCGGLTKFEPREVENLWVPSPAMLEEDSWRS